MKPIRLELAGLQSYREKQTVDFEGLCAGGVFGIFGPTGSGKSSILDAMTLALYGRVERAPKGTQGILNGAEAKLSVSLTFEMVSGEDKLRYRVERQYKRAGETSIHGAACRLVEVSEAGERVLADKQNEVDSGVEEIIGLTMTDFTRAVVLPQGKFAEFLTLAGKDRRQMLQRLFRLERYGDALAARLSARAEGVRSGLRETEAEQLGLGDASPEALAASTLRLAEARQEAAGLKQRLVQTELSHERLARRRERAESLRKVEAEWAGLAARAPEMAEQEKLVGRLEQAAQLLPVVRDSEEATAERDKAEREGAERLADSKHQRQLAEAAAARWTAAQETAAEAEPRLIQRLDRLEQALKLEEEAGRRAAIEKETVSAVEQTQARRLELDAAHIKALDLLRQAREKQAKLRTEWEALQPLADASRRLQEARSARIQADAAQTLASDVLKEADTQIAKAKAAAARLQSAEAGWQLEVVRGSELAARGGQLIELADRWLSKMDHSISTAVANAARESLQTEAAKLAAALKNGEPCPVCGATDHPSPAAPSGTSDSHLTTASVPDSGEQATAEQSWILLRQEATGVIERSRWETSRLVLLSKQAHDRLSAERQNADNLASSDGPSALDYGSYAEAAASAELAEAEYASVLPSFSFSADEAQVEQGKTEQELLHTAHKEWERLEPMLLQSAAELRQWEALLHSAAAERELAGVAERGERESLLAIHEKAERLSMNALEVRKEWQLRFPELSYDSVEREAADASRAEEASRELRKRLDVSISFIQDQETTAQLREREKHENAILLAEGQSRLNSIRSSIAELAAQLLEWTGGESAANLHRDALQQRASLQAETVEARMAHEAAQRKLNQSEAALAAALERQRTSSAQFDRAEARMREAIASAGFISSGEVRELAPRIGEVSLLKESIQAYRRLEQQLAGQMEMLRGQMAGEAPVDPEEWTASETELAELSAASQQAANIAAKAERDQEDLESRRGRWEMLEHRRTGLAEEQTQIAQLQSVFRGNAFVEYIAEEQLDQVCRTASERLSFLTRGRYALEVDAGGGFIIRDDANGGLRRPVSSLSGGETFLTSLALALALSTQIQLKGRYPLQFFFLDEGFGTLDPELLETVVTSLEKLQQDELAVGVISHVPELQARLPRRLVVIPAEPGGRGSRITF